MDGLDRYRRASPALTEQETADSCEAKQPLPFPAMLGRWLMRILVRFVLMAIGLAFFLAVYRAATG